MFLIGSLALQTGWGPSLWVIAGLLLFLSVLASKASERLGVPALLIFLMIGMLAGSDGPGGIWFDDPQVAQKIGILTLCFILFTGGFKTDLREVRPILHQGFLLSTVGVCLGTMFVGLFATFAFGFPLKEALLLGAIVSSTDAAAVFAVLGSKNFHLKNRLKHLVELESASNDPMSILLTIGLLAVLMPSETEVSSFSQMVPFFLKQFGIGLMVGYLLGRLGVFGINRIRLQYEGLYPVLAFSWVLLSYGFADAFGGSGFLAVYVSGLVAGNRRLVFKKKLSQFYDGLSWLLQIGMFLALGLLVFPSQLAEVAKVGIAVSLFLMFVARPLMVFLTLKFAKRLAWQEKLWISWAGLRGAAPIVLATFPLTAGLLEGRLIFNLVFFIVLSSVLIQGTTLLRLARILKLDTPPPRLSRYPLEFETLEGIKMQLVETSVSEGSAVVGKTLNEICLPKASLITLVGRNGELLVPDGKTTLEIQDLVLVLAQEKDLSFLKDLFQADANNARSNLKG